MYRELNQSDRIRIDSGLSILPKGQKDTIVDHVKGKDTGYIYIYQFLKIYLELHNIVQIMA